MDHDDFVLEGFNSSCKLLFFLSSNIGKTIEATTGPMAATAEVIIVVMEIVLAAIEIGVVDSAETAVPTIVEPVIATAEIASVVIAMAEIATVVIATVVIAIGVVDMAETVTMIGATMIVATMIVVTMIAEVASVLVTEIGDVTMMTGSVREVHGVTVEMQEAILIETRGSQVRE